MNNFIVGLDLSLAKTGYCIMNDEGTVSSSGLIKSKPSGKSYLAETRRIVKIVDDIFLKITESCKKKKPDMVVIEGLAFMARNTTSLVQLAGLNYYTRIKLDKLGIPFLIIAPGTLKKFITGSGRGDKSLMMMKVYKHYGFESMDDNVCDSFSLAVCGLATLGKPLKTPIKPQEEVIKLLKTQI